MRPCVYDLFLPFFGGLGLGFGRQLGTLLLLVPIPKSKKVLFKFKKSFFNFISLIRSKNAFRGNINLFDFKKSRF